MIDYKAKNLKEYCLQNLKLSYSVKKCKVNIDISIKLRTFIPWPLGWKKMPSTTAISAARFTEALVTRTDYINNPIK